MRMPPNVSSRNSAGEEMGIIDTCLYVLRDTVKKQVAYILVYVDDLVVVFSHKEIKERIVRAHCERLPIDDRGPLEWILRMQITRDEASRSITVSQEQYLGRLLEKHSSWNEVGRK